MLQRSLLMLGEANCLKRACGLHISQADAGAGSRLDESLNIG